MRAIIAFIFSILFYSQVFAQEFNATITIDKQQVPDIQQTVLDDLKQSITNFFNNRRWTNDQFTQDEKIKFNLLVTLKSGTTVGSYSANAQLQLVRPIYNTTYETVVFTFLDTDFTFAYIQGQPIDYNENIYVSSLVSMLSFYAFVMVSMDYDSFAKLGGTPYIEKMYNIAIIAQSSDGSTSWSPGDFKNRWGLATNLNSQQFIPFRECFYNYHYEALDRFLLNPDDARAKIIEVLKKIKTVRLLNPMSILINSFFLAKRDEIINIFSQAQPDVKTAAVNLLRELDPPNSEKYNAIMK